MLRSMNAIVRMVFVQIIITNPKIFGQVVKEMGSKKQSAGGGPPTGKHLMDIKDGSLAEFVTDLNCSGYQLVTGSYDERPNQKDRSGKSSQYIARFGFALDEFAQVDDTIEGMEVEILADLTKVCQEADWGGIRIYSNPFFAEGVEVAGHRVFEIGAIIRKPVEAGSSCHREHLRITANETIEVLKD